MPAAKFYPDQHQLHVLFQRFDVNHNGVAQCAAQRAHDVTRMVQALLSVGSKVESLRTLRPGGRVAPH